MDYLPNESAYRNWRAQRCKHLENLQNSQPPAWNILVSVVVSAKGPNSASELDVTLQSLLEQNWNNVEVSIFLGGQNSAVDKEPFSHLRGLVVCQGQEIGDLFRYGPKKFGLRGDYVLVVNSGTVFDISAFSALNRVVVERVARSKPDIVLFDYEYSSGNGQIVYPAFLPGFDPDFLENEDYIGNAALIRADLFDVLAKSATLTCVRDVLLAATKEARKLNVDHVQEILMRVRRNNVTPKKKSIASKVSAIPKTSGVAVIIPSRNKSQLLRQCVKSMMPSKLVKELIIVDNASDDPETLDLYKMLERDHGARIVEMNQPFNFSRMINLGVELSRSDVLLLLNNDIEFKKSDVLMESYEAALRPDVGIVGSKLLYPDLTIQHFGVLLEYYPNEYLIRAMHVGRGAESRSLGYLGQYAHARNFQAVTGAFMMLRREVFDKAGGFDELALPVEYNDIDFCLRVGEAGYKILCLPLQGVIHHESASRGKIDTDQVLKMRFAAQALMARRWLSKFRNDPYNHPIARLGEKAEVRFNFTGAFIG